MNGHHQRFGVRWLDTALDWSLMKICHYGPVAKYPKRCQATALHIRAARKTKAPKWTRHFGA
jgi:hypothetical protein